MNYNDNNDKLDDGKVCKEFGKNTEEENYSTIFIVLNIDQKIILIILN